MILIYQFEQTIKLKMIIFLPFIFSLQIFKFVVCENRQTSHNRNQNVQENLKLPLIINTWAFTEANAVACKVLQEKPRGNALEALVAGCSRCEQLQCDGTVGFGGSPDERGETTLDALIMDGSDLNIGAVAAMRQIKDAIKVARYVLEHTEHSLLVGDAASDFAIQMGFNRESLITDKSFEMYRTWRWNQCQPNFWKNVFPNPYKQCGPYTPISISNDNQTSRAKHRFGKYNHDTIGMIVIDHDANIFAGTSTNGARHKIPGRVGDSPIPGAGAYADNTVGAAVSTGDGDVMMRFLPSFMAIEEMRNGKSPKDAADKAIKRILDYYPIFTGGIIVANRKGDYGASCAGMNKFPISVAQGTLEDATRIIYIDCMNKSKY